MHQTVQEDHTEYFIQINLDLFIIMLHGFSVYVGRDIDDVKKYNSL